TDNVLGRLKQTKRPLEVAQKEFGLIAALVQVSSEIGLTQLLQERFVGECFGVPLWLYFFVTIINRLQQATSKEQMGAWAQKTILPELFDFDPNVLNSKSFWYAADAVLSEAELQSVRAAKDVLSDALDSGVFDEGELRNASELLEGKVNETQLDNINKLLVEGITEANLRAAKEAKAGLTNELFLGIDESVFHEIVEKLSEKIKTKFGFWDP